MSDAARQRQKGRPPRGSNRRRPTQAQSLARQIQIVADHDLHHLTFAEISAKHGMGEKEAREAYQRHTNEIVPLLLASTPDHKAAGYLRALEDTRKRLQRLAENADNDSAAVGAHREIVKTILEEIKLCQHLGLMPKEASEIRLVPDHSWMAQKIAELLERAGAPPEALAELERILSGGGEAEPRGAE
jgi:hypothetical protein